MANSYYELLRHNNSKIQWLEIIYFAHKTIYLMTIYFAHETAKCMGSMRCHCAQRMLFENGLFTQLASWCRLLTGSPAGLRAGGLSSSLNGPLHRQSELTQRTADHCKGECSKKTGEKLRGLFQVVTTRLAVSLWPQSFGQGSHKGPPAFIDPTSQCWSHWKNSWIGEIVAAILGKYSLLQK